MGRLHVYSTVGKPKFSLVKENQIWRLNLYVQILFLWQSLIRL